MFTKMILLAASVLILTTTVFAAKFSQELSYSHVQIPEIIKSDYDKQSNFQQVLSKDTRVGKTPASSRGLPIQINDWYMYTTIISLGTPPQSFRAIVDLSWTELFVPSITCGGSHCEEKTKYNASASSTYVEEGTRKQTWYGPVIAYGQEAIDTFTLGSGLQVPSQHFQELKYYEMVYPDNELKYFDSVLGLCYETPQFAQPGGSAILPSPFRNMVDNGILDSNVFSILLPLEDRIGDLMFGGYNESFLAGDLIKHPLFPSNTTNWQVEGGAISIYGEDKCGRLGTLLNESLAGYETMLMTNTPMTFFPASLGNQILEELNTTYSVCMQSEVVDCENLHSLPIITLTLDGQDFELHGKDYVAKFEPERCKVEGPQCVPMFEGVPDWQLPDNFPENWAILGTTILKSFYMVFDWDEKSIGFGKLEN